MKNITNDIIYVGVNDFEVDLFEGQYKVPNGMCYNSYVVMDEKVTVFDTVDANFNDKWLENLDKALNNRKPDYLVVQHMEPDHSANIFNFAKKYPDALIVANAKTFVMMKQFFGTEFENRRVVVKDGESLNTGKHTFTFVFAPMVHWPEVMVTYDSFDRVLFSADGFGKFGSFDAKEQWVDEARRYFIGIVGKYGMQVQNLLKKASTLDIQIICPLHGPILTENLGYYLDLYNTWSSYSVEEEGIVLAYTSVYGNTKKAVELLANNLKELGEKVTVYDLARCDMSQAVADAFRYGKLVLATLTYNGDVFPFMRDFIAHLTERNYQNRTIGLIENGSWAATAAKVMKTKFEKSKNIKFTDTVVTIKSAVNDDTIKDIKKLAEEIHNA
ncbi:MAG: MBL fold metallo-hydrolase [Clostridiales bacterium]|nr:MBL fold metallo-hydrolase [Clostridiales bacterium]MDY2729362.1 MBL fold metallo-hydrolase [Clostridium sp.]